MKRYKVNFNALKVPLMALSTMGLAAAATATPLSVDQTLAPTLDISESSELHADACKATLASNGILAIDLRRAHSIAGYLNNRLPNNSDVGPMLDLAENFSVFERRALRTRAGTYLHRTSNSAVDSNCEIS